MLFMMVSDSTIKGTWYDLCIFNKKAGLRYHM